MTTKCTHDCEHAQPIQHQLHQERERLSLRLEVNNAVVSTRNLHALLNTVSASPRAMRTPVRPWASMAQAPVPTCSCPSYRR
jgi:hypothetical protein